MRLLLVCFLLLGLTFKGYTQDSYSSGIIINSITGSKVINAAIVVYEKDKITGSFVSDSLGKFKIPMSIFSSCTHLEVNNLHYEKFIYQNKISTKKDVNLGQFKLVPKGITLKEVVINNSRRYRDTLNIDLSKEHFDRSFMIGDFLSSNNGFSKNKDGKLFFKGKEVADIVLNGGNFFGKNNLDIYKYLPSLTLDNIEITETNIDSITNTILLKPMVKVNLKLKEEFKKGKFGSVNLGYGTSDRYVLASDLYTYKNNEQISLVLNSNNINSGDNPYTEPNVSFSPNGNNTVGKSAKLSYRNLFLKNKIEVEASVKGKIEDRKFNSEMLRQEETINQFSKTSNSSTSRNLGLESTNLNISYQIDSLNKIYAKESIDYSKSDQDDSLRYEIQSGNKNTLSELSKLRRVSVFSFSNAIQYHKRFASNRGRSINVSFNSDFKKYNTSENNNVLDIKNLMINKYFINGSRYATQKNVSLDVNFIEPLGDSGYLSFFVGYKDEKFQYDANSISDSIPSYKNEPALLNNRYLQPGLKFQKAFKKLSIDGELINIINFRKIVTDLKTDEQTLFNLNINAFIDYKINNKNTLSARYTTRMNYPGIAQLTAINNSFDLITQMQGNIYLKPEIGKKIELTYNLRKTDSLTFSFSSAAEFYKSKFGYNINNQPGSYQTNYIDNIGSSKSYNFVFSLYKIFNNGTNINYRIATDYNETPVVNNNQTSLNRGININQSVSSSFSLFNHLSVEPSLSATFTEYQYDTDKSKMYNLIYSDKVSFAVPKICTLSIYPLVNYAYNINSNLSWAINGEIKRDFLKKYCSVWVKAYDIFNSFNYTNNFLGASYSQSLKYSNLNRYVLVGASLKFNNMK